MLFVYQPPSLYNCNFFYVNAYTHLRKFILFAIIYSCAYMVRMKNNGREAKNMRIEETNANKEELNYKQGYAHLFNGIGEMIKLQMRMAKKMMVLQQESEEICIGSQLENSDIDSEQVIERLADIIKQNME